MNQESDFNYIVCQVLNKIKSCLQKTNIGKPACYDIQLSLSNNTHPSSQDEFEVFKHLLEWKAIKLHRRRIAKELHVLIDFETIQPTFDEICKKFGVIRRPCYNHDIFDIDTAKQSDLHLNYDKQLQHNEFLQEKVRFSKFYLQREIETLEGTLRHFFQIGAVNQEDFALLSMNTKMLKKFLERDLPITKKRKKKRQKAIVVKKQQPLPITGEIVVTGLTESLKALGTKSPEYSGPKFPYKIPSGTFWHNIIIKFLTDEQIEIHIKRLKHITDYKEMGMIGKGKIPKPGEQWTFLRVLALRQGELTIKDPEAKDKYKKQKRALSETLRNYFSIDYDPFYPYQSSPEKQGNSYKIKLLLLPPPAQKHSEQYEEQDVDKFGIQEFLNEETPFVAGY